MLFLITVTFRQGVSYEDSRAAAHVLKDRLMNPNPGITVRQAVADLGGGEIHITADLNEAVLADIKQILEFRALRAVERIEYTPVVDAAQALDVFLGIDFERPEYV
jgi:hypothetical protein